MGVLKYFTWQEKERRYCEIPLMGYGAQQGCEEKIIGRLFQKLADQIVEQGSTSFSMHVYAHDEKIKQLFSYMQFGMMAETGIRKISNEYEAKQGANICTLSKNEVLAKWQEVWLLTKCIIDHLKESPIFYKGEEFTEEMYKDFFMDQGTHVHVAYDNEGKLIGLIESNEDENTFVFGDQSSRNVGEAYVVPAYRGSGLSQQLLFYAEAYEAQRGAIWSWVEHGTANPNARGFWNKYFKTYQYEMIRNI